MKPEVLAQTGLEKLGAARSGLTTIPRAARPALLAGWQAGGVLRLAAREPERVASGKLALSEFSRRGGLIRAALTGRI